MEQSYDRLGNLKQWNWGDLSETYNYDQNGRLTGLARGNVTFLTYQYKEKFDMLPHTVYLGNYYKKISVLKLPYTILVDKNGHLFSYLVVEGLMFFFYFSLSFAKQIF